MQKVLLQKEFVKLIKTVRFKRNIENQNWLAPMIVTKFGLNRSLLFHTSTCILLYTAACFIDCVCLVCWEYDLSLFRCIMCCDVCGANKKYLNLILLLL